MSRYRRGTGGYTIIEVMIVLTISTMLFASAVAAYTIQNHRNQFPQSVNNFAQDLQDILNDVETGFYPSNSDFYCRANLTGSPFFPTLPPNKQGTNTDCTFVGKAIQFAPQGTDKDNIDVYTIVGRRLVEGSTTVPVSSIDQAKPKGLEKLVDRKALLNGVEISSIKRADGTNLSGIAMVVNSGSASISTGLNSRAALASVNGTLNDSKNAFLGTVGTGGIQHITSANITAAQGGINICVKETGFGGRTAIIELATGGTQSIIINAKVDQPCS